MRWRDDEEPETTWIDLRYLGERTEHAVRVAPADDDDAEGVWLPWSQVHAIENDDGPVDPDDFDTRVDHGSAATFEVSTWLAEREGWT